MTDTGPNNRFETIHPGHPDYEHMLHFLLRGKAAVEQRHGFPREYDTWTKPEQANYEKGRLLVTEALWTARKEAADAAAIQAKLAEWETDW
jgi:hypothetical protein